MPTSILYDPPNGRRPATLEGVTHEWETSTKFIHTNTGTQRLEKTVLGRLMSRSLAPSGRCLISFAATVPTLPSLYNNYKRIVQTDDYVMILQEMVHDARIIKIDGEHSNLRINLGSVILLVAGTAIP